MELTITNTMSECLEEHNNAILTSCWELVLVTRASKQTERASWDTSLEPRSYWLYSIVLYVYCQQYEVWTTCDGYQLGYFITIHSVWLADRYILPVWLTAPWSNTDTAELILDLEKLCYSWWQGRSIRSSIYSLIDKLCSPNLGAGAVMVFAR